MAAVVVTGTGRKIKLEMSEDEAQYVRAALLSSSPKYLDGDPVYVALTEAMEDAGIAFVSDAAE